MAASSKPVSAGKSLIGLKLPFGRRASSRRCAGAPARTATRSLPTHAADWIPGARKLVLAFHCFALPPLAVKVTSPS